MNELALFAGAGGGILGGKLVGWRTVCAVEWNPFAAGLLAARQNEGALPPFPIWDDVRTFDGRPWRGTVDVVSGGFPCQDISAAGKGKGLEGERSGMWREMARIVGEVGPEWVFVENSPMLTVRGLGTVLADLAALGFDAQWGVLGAAELGAKHRRERIWIAAHSQLHGRDGRTLRGSAGASEEERRLLQLEGLAAWGSEPDVARVVDGVATPLDKARVKALGNGQVPQVAAAAWRLLTAGKSNTHNAELTGRHRMTTPEDANTVAGGSPVERGVGRPESERDQDGPRGTYGCACVSDSARLCTLLRYDRDIDSREQHDDDCECLCHQWRDDDDYLG